MCIYNTSNLKNGLKVLINDEPYVILDNQFHKPGKGQAFSKLKIRNLINGRIIDKTLKIGDSLDSADINEKDMQFLYTQGEELIFMDEETFDQISISTSVASSVSSWLKVGEKCAIIFFNGNAINITPPTFVEFKISNKVDIEALYTSSIIWKIGDNCVVNNVKYQAHNQITIGFNQQYFYLKSIANNFD